MTEVREASQDEYVLAADDRLFTAVYRHPPATSVLPPMTLIPLGSSIRVTGICMIVEGNTINPGAEVPFNILMRSFDDITVVAPPFPLNIRNLIIVVCALLLVVFAVLARGWALERKVRRQTAALAAHRAAAAAAFSRTSTAPVRWPRSWRRSRDWPPSSCMALPAGARSPMEPGWETARRSCTACASSSARFPPAPARRWARSLPAFDPLQHASAIESEALSMAAGLATLAIETRRLYSDLRRRSEFDLLTDIHNRFSLEKLLDAQIEEARENAGIFGLIYIDLDEFKPINDLYGHHVGDLYLQEVAQRMKQQLRAADMLARLGGDEFAALVPGCAAAPTSRRSPSAWNTASTSRLSSKGTPCTARPASASPSTPRTAPPGTAC